MAELPFHIIAIYIVKYVYAGVHGAAGSAHHVAHGAAAAAHSAGHTAPAAHQAVTHQATGSHVGTVANDLLRYGTLATNPQVLKALNSLHDRVKKRAKEISAQPGHGSDLANWLLAEREVLTRERAEEIAKSGESKGGPWDNWLQAELEIVTAQRARAIATDPRRRGSDFDNWIAGEREARISIRAEDIARKNPRASAQANWFEAERQLGLRQ